LREEAVRWDPAGTAADDVDSINAEVERGACGVFFLDEFGFAEADAFGLRAEDSMLLRIYVHLDAEAVLGTASAKPPEGRVFEFKFGSV
jgi:hypothetical protein